MTLPGSRALSQRWFVDTASNDLELLSHASQSLNHGLLLTAALGMEKDPGLASLEGDPCFVTLVAYAKKRPAATNPSE